MAIFYTIFLFFFSNAGMASTLYTMADLEALANEGAYKEFFAHALDIRPSERQGEWKLLVQKMGDLYTKDLNAKAELKKEDFNQLESFFSWAPLKEDDLFRLRRKEIGLKHLKKCLKSNPPCWQTLKSFWEKDKADPELAYNLALLVQDIKDPQITTWDLLEVSLKSPLSEFYCKKEFVMDALWGKIEIDYIRLGPDGDLMKKIDLTIHPDCTRVLVGEAQKRLSSPRNSSDRELAFNILKSQLKDTQEVQDFFYTVYLMETPSQGDLFNYAWNRVSELGKSSKRRDQIMAKVKKLDPVPDNILGSLDQKKKKAILSHMKKNFPEYMDHYTKQCILFYQGVGSFPSGNPTVNCQSFMESDLAQEIVDDFQIKRFEEARKI